MFVTFNQTCYINISFHLLGSPAYNMMPHDDCVEQLLPMDIKSHKSMFSHKIDNIQRIYNNEHACFPNQSTNVKKYYFVIHWQFPLHNITCQHYSYQAILFRFQNHPPHTPPYICIYITPTQNIKYIILHAEHTFKFCILIETILLVSF